MIYAVTGQGRCGSTMLMRMLAAGGMDVHADDRVGFESADVLGLPTKYAFLYQCDRKVLKIVQPLTRLPRWPKDHSLKIRWVYLSRDPVEQATSHFKMLLRMNADLRAGAKKRLEANLASENARTPDVLGRWSGSAGVYILTFEEILAVPKQAAAALCAFLERPLDIERMTAEVLQRPPRCMPGFYIEDSMTPLPAFQPT